MRWLAWLLLILALAGCREGAPAREVRVVVSGSGRLARARAFGAGLRGYDPKNVELTVCDADWRRATLLEILKNRRSTL